MGWDDIATYDYGWKTQVIQVSVDSNGVEKVKPEIWAKRSPVHPSEDAGDLGDHTYYGPGIF